MSSESNLALIATLRSVIERSGLSYQDIAEGAGIHRSQVYRFMSSKTLTLVSAAKLFDFLKLRIIESDDTPRSSTSSPSSSPPPPPTATPRRAKRR